MDKESEFYRGCLKKKRYSTAKLAAAVKNKVFKERGINLRIYKCSACNGYHLTSILLG
jgi:hypothetical protein